MHINGVISQYSADLCCLEIESCTQMSLFPSMVFKIRTITSTNTMDGNVKVVLSFLMIVIGMQCGVYLREARKT